MPGLQLFMYACLVACMNGIPSIASEYEEIESKRREILSYLATHETASGAWSEATVDAHNKTVFVKTWRRFSLGERQNECTIEYELLFNGHLTWGPMHCRREINSEDRDFIRAFYILPALISISENIVYGHGE